MGKPSQTRSGNTGATGSDLCGSLPCPRFSSYFGYCHHHSDIREDRTLTSENQKDKKKFLEAKKKKYNCKILNYYDGTGEMGGEVLLCRHKNLRSIPSMTLRAGHSSMCPNLGAEKPERDRSLEPSDWPA